MNPGRTECNAGSRLGERPVSRPIVQATAEELHRVYYKPRHKPRLRWSDALFRQNKERGITIYVVSFPESLTPLSPSREEGSSVVLLGLLDSWSRLVLVLCRGLEF